MSAFLFLLLLIAHAISISSILEGDAERGPGIDPLGSKTNASPAEPTLYPYEHCSKITPGLLPSIFLTLLSYLSTSVLSLYQSFDKMPCYSEMTFKAKKRFE